MLKLLSKLPYFITGDNYEQLKRYDPNSRKKISILGWFAFIPSFLWFLSSFLLSYKILNTHFGLALIVGLASALVIFIFERNIVQSAKTHWVLALLRVILGFSIAVFSSVILDLVIFKNDIDFYAQSQIISREEQKVNEASINYQAAIDRFNNEMDGSSNTKMIGLGRIAKEKREQVVIEKNKLEQSKAELMKLKARYTDTNNPETIQNSSEIGLNTILNRVKLLHEFVNQNILALYAWLILFIIGALLEVFGVLTKCFYPKTTYEEDQEALKTMMNNRRRVLLEQSMYYANLGVHGNHALITMENRNQSIFN